MSILRLWRYLLALVLSCLCLSAMATPRLVTSGSGDTLKLMGVRDILVNNVAYNVSFAHGECEDFNPSCRYEFLPFGHNENTAVTAYKALSDSVFGSGNQFSHQPLRINGCSEQQDCWLSTQFDLTFSCNCFKMNVYLAVTADPTVEDRILTSPSSMPDSMWPNTTYANWTPVPVPEPTGWAMYGAGVLALTGLARRRAAGNKST